MMLHRLKTLLLLFIVSTFLFGCGYKDIDKRFFTVAIGIDYEGDNEEKPYKLSLALAVPSTTIEPKSAITQIESINATNISDGLRQIKTKLDKELDLGHCKVIIIGEALANHDVTDVVYWIARRRDVQNIAALAIGIPNAEKIISVKPESDRFPGNTLNFFFSNDTTESSYSYITSFTEIYKRIQEPGFDPVLPIISAEKDETYVVNSIALLDKQKVKLTLSPRETQIFNQLSKHSLNGKITGTFEYEKVTMAINQLKTAYKINESVANPVIDMTIKQTVVLEELPKNSQNEGSNKYSKLIHDIEQQYSKESTALFDKIRAAKIDPFGFGLRYRAKRPLTLEQFEETWPTIYENIAFNISTKINLKSAGLLK